MLDVDTAPRQCGQHAAQRGRRFYGGLNDRRGRIGAFSNYLNTVIFPVHRSYGTGFNTDGLDAINIGFLFFVSGNLFIGLFPLFQS